MSHRQHFDRFVSEQSKQHDVWEASKASTTYDGRTQKLRECSRPFRDAGDRGVQRSQKLLAKLRLALGVKSARFADLEGRLGTKANLHSALSSSRSSIQSTPS